MPRVDAVRIALMNEGIRRGTLTLRAIPSNALPLLWDFRDEADFDATLNPVQVLELEEYIFIVETDAPGTITTDKPELFSPDYRHGKVGRFRPGLDVGQLQITFSADQTALGK